MKITKQFLERGGTKAEWGFSWTNKQVEILGETKSKGWVTRLIGKEITDEQAKQFLELNPNRYELSQDYNPDINHSKTKGKIWYDLLPRVTEKGDIFFNKLVSDIESLLDN